MKTTLLLAALLMLSASARADGTYCVSFAATPENYFGVPAAPAPENLAYGFPPLQPRSRLDYNYHSNLYELRHGRVCELWERKWRGDPTLRRPREDRFPLPWRLACPW
jgi:hypothetical protein